MGGRQGLQPIALLLLSCLLTVGGAPDAALDIGVSGELVVLAVDGPGPAHQEVYLHASDGASVLKLEGPTVAAMRGLHTGHQPLQVADLPTLVLPISFEGCDAPEGGQYGQPWYRQEDIESVLFERGEASDAWATVGGRLRACSYNRTSLTHATSKVAPLLRLPCNGTNSWGAAVSSLSCEYDDFMGWLEAAEGAAAAAGIDLRRYRHRVALLPPGVVCPFYGIASQGCTDRCMAWVQGADVMGSGSPGCLNGTGVHPILHELGHNLFLGHANTYSPDGSVDTYGDLSCVLGQCCGARCFNAPHAWQLGWTSPQQLDSGSLPVGQPHNVTFASQSRTAQAGLRIDAPRWAGNASDPLYLSLRLPEGGDSQLGWQFTTAVSVHSGASRGGKDAQLTFLLATVPAGASWAHNDSGLVISSARALPRAAGFASSGLGLKDVAAAAATKLSQAVQGNLAGDAGSTARPEAWQGLGSDAAASAASTAASAGASGGSFAGAPVEPSQRDARPFTEADVPGMMPEESFAGDCVECVDRRNPADLPTFNETDPVEAAKVPLQPSGLEEQFEDTSFKGV
ncbi:hypothetical protein ABPG75_006738 [Micractinium tetrahymenae]